MDWLPAAGAEQALLERIAVAERLIRQLDDVLSRPLPGEDALGWSSQAQRACAQRLDELRWVLQEARRHLERAQDAANRLLALAPG